MGIPFEKTEYAKPRPWARFDELGALVERLVLHYGERLLLLPEAERVSAVVAHLRELLPVARLVEIDANGLDAAGFVHCLREELLPRYGLENVERTDDPGILLQDLGAQLPHFFKDAGFVTGKERPLLLIWGVTPELAVGLFARGRDEMWGLGLATVVVAAKEDKDDYLLTVSDSYFMRNIYWVRDYDMAARRRYLPGMDAPDPSRFIFCAYRYDDDLVGPLTVVYTSTRQTFEQDGHIDDDYDDGDWERLLEVTDRAGLGELMESVWEAPRDVSPKEIRAVLEAELDFSYSDDLLGFILIHDPVGGPQPLELA